MTPNRHGSSAIEFPSELEILTTREFDAPLELVFDVLTKPEHLWHWFAPFDDVLTVCSVDLRVGGSYHIVGVTPDGTECVFRGTYLEVDPPRKLVYTWGWAEEGSAVVPPGSTTVEVTFESIAEATVVRVVHTGLPEEAFAFHSDGWDEGLSGLHAILATAR